MPPPSWYQEEAGQVTEEDAFDRTGGALGTPVEAVPQDSFYYTDRDVSELPPGAVVAGPAPDFPDDDTFYTAQSQQGTTGQTQPPAQAVSDPCALDCYQTCAETDKLRKKKCVAIYKAHTEYMKSRGCPGVKCSMGPVGKTCKKKTRKKKAKKKKATKRK